MVAYIQAMPKSTPPEWGKRFRVLAKSRGYKLADVAEKLGRTPAAVHHWTNGTRDINLSEFLELCVAAHLDPAEVLFAGRVDEKFLVVGEAWGKATDLEREVLWTAAQGILKGKGGGQSQPAVATVPRGIRTRSRP